MAASPLLDTKLEYLCEEGLPVATTVRLVDEARLSRARPIRVCRSFARQRHYPGLFWSATTRGHVPYESRLELDRLWIADYDPEVVWIVGQPMWLRGQDGDTVRKHVPDFLLTDPAGHLTVVDVKPAQFLDRPEVAAQFAWTDRLCRAKGWVYEVWSGEDRPDPAGQHPCHGRGASVTALRRRRRSRYAGSEGRGRPLSGVVGPSVSARGCAAGLASARATLE